MADRPTCVIVDDHAIVRDGIRLRIETEGLLEVVGEAGDGQSGWELVRDLEPDIALLDLRTPVLDGMEVAKRAREAELRTKLVIISGMASRALIERAFAVGADAYVGKESHRDVLLSSIRVALSGERFVDPMLAARFVERGSQALSPRENEVLGLMAEGLPNAEIAERMGITADTVRNHVASVMRKLEASSRTAAVSSAFRRAMLY